MRWQLLVVMMFGSICIGCGSDTVQDVDLDAAAEDAGDDAIVTGDGGEEATSDGSVEDSTPDVPSSETTSDSTLADSGTPDSTKIDVGLGDTSSALFACGSETCSSKFQFCRKDTSPGTCPAPDSGTCPAGCPGCAPLGFHCQALPSKCFAAPSCMCLVGEVCGFSGSCDEMGGFTVGCKGI